MLVIRNKSPLYVGRFHLDPTPPTFPGHRRPCRGQQSPVQTQVQLVCWRVGGNRSGGSLGSIRHVRQALSFMRRLLSPLKDRTSLSSSSRERNRQRYQRGTYRICRQTSFEWVVIAVSSPKAENLAVFPQDLTYGYYSLKKKHGDPKKHLDWAIVEATAITEDGHIVPGNYFFRLSLRRSSEP